MSADYVDGSVPIAVAARVYGKERTWVRAGIISGYLPIGIATRDGEPVTGMSTQLRFVKAEDKRTEIGPLTFSGGNHERLHYSASNRDFYDYLRIYILADNLSV